MIEYNINAESAVAGSILIDDSCLRDVREIITVDDFWVEKYGIIFKAACQLQDESKPVDPVTVLEVAGVSKTLVMELMQATPTAANVLSYAEIMRNASAQRQIIQAIDESKSTIESREEEPSTVAMRLSDELTGIVDQQTKSDLVTSADLCHRF